MTGQYPRIYDTTIHNDLNQSFITCYFKISYTTHTITYDISSQIRLERLYNTMSERIRSDLYLELSEANKFEFVVAGQNAQEEGEPLSPRFSTRLRDIAETDHISFYIRPIIIPKQEDF